MSTPEELEFEAGLERAIEGLEKAQKEFEEFHRWLEVGVERKWISEPVCETHDGVPYRIDEAEDFEEGADPCILVLRVWMDGYGDLPE